MSTCEESVVYSNFSDDPDFRELLEEFLSTILERREKISEACNDLNYNDVKILAHQIKGAGGGYGFDGLTDLAADLEAAADAESPQPTSEAFVRLSAYIDRIRLC